MSLTDVFLVIHLKGQFLWNRICAFILRKGSYHGNNRFKEYGQGVRGHGRHKTFENDKSIGRKLPKGRARTYLGRRAIQND